MQGDQAQDSEISTQAVIYLGPSSMSLMVAEVAENRIRMLDFLQQPVPMARDIFRLHRISRHTMDRCVQIIGDYLEILKEYGTGVRLSVRLMISNIISEADNVDVFVNRMHVAHGLRGRRIDDGKMTRLIYVKVQETLARYPGFSKKKVLVVHTGPGNTRVLLFQKGRIMRYSCYRRGTHRTGEAVGEIEYGDDVTELSLLREHMRGQVDQICLDYGGVKGLAGLVVIGQEMQQLRERLNPSAEGKVSCSALVAEAEKMSRTTMEQRMNVYGADFAGVDSLLPAVLMTEMIARSLNLNDVIIPDSGYEEEFLGSLIRAERHPEDLEAEVLHFAGILADRYKADKGHREHVAHLCMEMFDQLQDLHRLSEHDRLLLEVASILHEVGSFISQQNHQLHSQYIILNSEIFGLSRDDVETVALLARYHRHEVPSNSDPMYGELELTDRMRVAKMAAILRVADALERGHAQRVNGVRAHIRGRMLELELQGVRETAVEDLALRLKGDLFADIFGYDVVLVPQR